MIFSTTLFGALYGCIVGLIWAFALNLSHKSGLTYGAIIGALLALIFAIHQKYAEIKANRELREMTKTSGNFFFILLVVGVSSGLIAWIVRAVFFK